MKTTRRGKTTFYQSFRSKKQHSGQTTSLTVIIGLDFFDQLPEEAAAVLQLEAFDNKHNLSSDDQYWLDMDGIQRPQLSLILASDMMAYSNDADLVANTIMKALVEGRLHDCGAAGDLMGGGNGNATSIYTTEEPRNTNKD
eukprot:15352764-Ditylum_brightwellii.AAC.1